MRGGDDEDDAVLDDTTDLPAAAGDLDDLNLADRIPSAGGSDIGGRAPDEAEIDAEGT